jgi:hypothetical protein
MSRKRKVVRYQPTYRHCEQCGKRSYRSLLDAKIDGAQWNQRAYECPAGSGWHLTKLYATQEISA